MEKPKPTRLRRSCLSVPGSSPGMLAKAPTIPADEVFLDLEDAVAPNAKEAARENVIEALTDGDWTGKTVGVRINDVSTRWCAKDIITVVEGAGPHLDVLIVPKVESASDVRFVDHLLRMVGDTMGLDKRIGIEIQIESAAGLQNIHEIAAATDRAEALIFGPADMSVDLRIPALTVATSLDGYPGDHWHYILFHILVAARANGLQAIDGPYLLIQDLDGYREVATRSRALGYDGKWALHPVQVDVVNEVFSPTQEEFDKASVLLEAYRHSTEKDLRGAVMFGNEMIDEASRKMAEQLATRGRAAGLEQVKTLADFTGET